MACVDGVLAPVGGPIPLFAAGSVPPMWASYPAAGEMRLLTALECPEGSVVLFVDATSVGAEQTCEEACGGECCVDPAQHDHHLGVPLRP